MNRRALNPIQRQMVLAIPVSLILLVAGWFVGTAIAVRAASVRPGLPFAPAQAGKPLSATETNAMPWLPRLGAAVGGVLPWPVLIVLTWRSKYIDERDSGRQ